MKRLTPLVLSFLLSLGLGAAPGAGAPARTGEFMTLLDPGDAVAARSGGPAEDPLYRLDPAALRRDPDRLVLPLPDGRVLVAFRAGDSRRDGGDFTWSGELQQEVSAEAPSAPGSVAFYLVGDHLFGTLRTQEGGYFELLPEGDLHRLVAYPAGKGDPCGLGNSASALASEAAGGEISEKVGILLAGSDNECPTPSGPNKNITVLVLYPRSLSGNPTVVNNYASLRIAEANTLFANSNIKITYQQVPSGSAVMITGEQPTGPDASGGPSAPLATGPVLRWLNGQFTGAIDTEVEMLRDYYGADLVMVVIPEYNAAGNFNCGAGNVPKVGVKPGGQPEEQLSGGTEPFAGQAFAVVEMNCGNADYTFAHELAHTFGLRHDDDPRNETPVYPWAYGHLLCQANPTPATVAATVMACFWDGSSCRRIPRFSHPDLPYVFGGISTETGVQSSEVGTLCMPFASHNACVVNNRAGNYEVLEAAPPSTPPSLTITSPAHGEVLLNPGTLYASASDAQDGNRAAFVQWTSNRQGFLGTGSPLNVTFTHYGLHRITATVSDTSGTQISKSIEVLVLETNPPLLGIDSPPTTPAVGGNYKVVVWAIDQSGVPNPPTFKLNGQPITLTSLQRKSRYDVCALNPTLGDPQCQLPEKMVGWDGMLNTQKWANGTYTLEMTARDLFNRPSVATRTFTTYNVVTDTFLVVEDAWVSQAAPTANYGSAQELEMRSTGPHLLASHAYLKFEVAGITRQVISARLGVYKGPAAWNDLHIFRLATNTWSEFTVNWLNGPLDPVAYLHLTPPVGGPYVYLDVSEIVKASTQPFSNDTYTFGVVTSDDPGNFFYSKEFGLHANRTPFLEVKY